MAFVSFVDLLFLDMPELLTCCDSILYYIIICDIAGENHAYGGKKITGMISCRAELAASDQSLDYLSCMIICSKHFFWLSAQFYNNLYI